MPAESGGVSPPVNAELQRDLGFSGTTLRGPSSATRMQAHGTCHIGEHVADFAFRTPAWASASPALWEKSGNPYRSPHDRPAPDMGCEIDLGQRYVQERAVAVRDVMTPVVHQVPVGASVGEAARMMVERHIHRLIVTQGKEPMGIITTMDLLRVIANSPEERWQIDVRVARWAQVLSEKGFEPPDTLASPRGHN